MPIATKLKARIKVGALIGEDFRYVIWPATVDGSPIDPNTIFTVERDSVSPAKPGEARVELWCDGHGAGIFGRPGLYGNGCFRTVEKNIIYVGPYAKTN